MPLFFCMILNVNKKYKLGDYMSDSIGIIGGSNGPTEIFVAGQPIIPVIIGVVVIIAAVTVGIIMKKKKG